jgi:hypothetical protein
MNDLKIFVPMTKIDAAQRLVFGVVTAERPDGSGEVCDYASTKPLYQKWSQGFADATDGRSLGNLRAMHGSVAAGNRRHRHVAVRRQKSAEGRALPREPARRGFAHGRTLRSRGKATAQIAHSRGAAGAWARQGLIVT